MSKLKHQLYRNTGLGYYDLIAVLMESSCLATALQGLIKYCFGKIYMEFTHKVQSLFSNFQIYLLDNT